MNSLVGVMAPSDPVGSFLVEILHSVEITKVFILVFEEANLRVHVVSSSCGSSV